VDGVQQPIAVRQGPATIPLHPCTRPLTIGAQIDPVTGWYYYSEALVDEVSIYNRALAAAEIQAIYNAGSAGKCAASSAPLIVTQPANQKVTVGASASFTVTAGGTPPPSYQWRWNGTNIAGATTTALPLSNVQSAQAGAYDVVIANTLGAVTSQVATLTVRVQTSPTLLNVNFAAYSNVKVGFAGTGQTSSDFWNNYTAPFQAYAWLSDMATADGASTTVGLTVQNGAGHWAFTHPDLMYDCYCYSQDHGDIILTVTNLPSGDYDFYLYGHEGSDTGNTVFQLLAGGADYGNRSTATNSDWALKNWVEGAQYVVFRNVAVTNGAVPVTILAHPGLQGDAQLNGMQIALANRAPVALCADVTVSAGTNCEADASINNGSFDPDGDSITVSQVPPGPYPLGTNRVTLTVADNKGASSSCSALIIVRDTTPPVLSCPGGQVLEFRDERGAVATYSVTATDPCSAVTLVVTPPSGSIFPIGVTSVHAQASDVSGNSTQCSFTLTVLGAQGVSSNLLAQLVALRSSARLTGPFAQMFDQAIKHLANSLNPAYWIDQTHLQPKGGETPMREAMLAVITLQEIMDSRRCPVDRSVLQGFIVRIVNSDRLLAVISIQDAAKAGLNARKIAEANAMVARGDEAAAAGHYANAIEYYHDAWRQVRQLRLWVSLNSNGTARLQFVGSSSKAYRIEVSTDLVKWVSLGKCTPDAEGNVEFTDPSVAKQPLRFYRAVEQ
jgi:hypothetical protein